VLVGERTRDEKHAHIHLADRRHESTRIVAILPAIGRFPATFGHGTAPACVLTVSLNHPHWGAPMVHDDDTPRTWNIDPMHEPLVMRAPRDDRTRDLILDTARTHPNRGRLRIHEELRDCGHDLDEPEVNFVPDQHKLPN
jgi:hypothetical protein